MLLTSVRTGKSREQRFERALAEVPQPNLSEWRGRGNVEYEREHAQRDRPILLRIEGLEQGEGEREMQ